MPPSREDQVVALLARLPRWARSHIDVRAIALVGSWAYGVPGPDSDVDLVLLTNIPERYCLGDDWVAELGGLRLVNTQSWGAITERRFVLPGGLEVELGVGRLAWASVSPVDDGTRRVVGDGLVAVYDPDGLLDSLLASCGSARDHPGGRER